MVASLRNVADEPFTIERLSLEGLERDDVAEVVRIWLAPRARAAPLPALGLYQTLPPVEDTPTGEGCAIQELVPARGTPRAERLAPEQAASQPPSQPRA